MSGDDEDWERLADAFLAFIAPEQQQLTAWRKMQEILRHVMLPVEYALLMDELWTDPTSPPGMAFDAFPRRKDHILLTRIRQLCDEGRLSKQLLDRLLALCREIDDQFGDEAGSPERFFQANIRQARERVQRYIEDRRDDEVATQGGIASALHDEVGIGRDALISIIRGLTGRHLKQRHSITFGELRRRLKILKN
jgi:hypothetical protein